MSLEYFQWTHGLYLYFTQNVPPGGEVYLSVDKETLTEIGPLIFKIDHSDWENHFLQAVRGYVFKQNVYMAKRLEHKWLQTPEGQTLCPKSVAYLAALVLAAHRMRRDEDVTDKAYFIRLRAVLDLEPGQSGRPSQLKSANSEQLLWEQWNAWLESNGWMSTALPGLGSHKYVNYPISQALLRDGDKDRLINEFSTQLKTGSLRRNWDQEHLAHWLSRTRRASSKVQAILERPDTPRYNALIESIYEVYISLSKSSADHSLATGPLSLEISGPRNLTAGLLRYEHRVQETVTYYPYPRQPRRAMLADRIALEQDDQKLFIHKQRSGWYEPLPTAIKNPAQSVEWHLEGVPGFNKLILPGADFWVLVRDPSDPDSHLWATWHRPQPGENFMLLCKSTYRGEMLRLKSLKLIDWADVFDVPELNGEWLEFENCMITNLDWEGVFASRSDLFDAIYPHLQISISLAGGLRTPGQEGWLSTHPPELRVSGVNTEVQITLFRYVQNEETLEKVQTFETQLTTNSSLPFPASAPGRYLIEAHHPRLGYHARRNLLLHDWSQIQPVPAPREMATRLPSNYCMQGAWIGGMQ